MAENTLFKEQLLKEFQNLLLTMRSLIKLKTLRGDMVECGVFRGASLSRFMSFDKIFKSNKEFIF